MIRFILYALFVSFLTIQSSPLHGRERKHEVHFPNTVYELNVYRIYGKTPGKTLLLIGGIQGNEPGGFLSADLYADMRLQKGNLIVVPRANFYSIILNQRGPHGDMNRKFTHEDNLDSAEDKIVSILKKLISESDYLLNLHDGSGYYHPTYINKWRNPSRFGQSVIADLDSYVIPETGKVIPLEEIANRALEKVNRHITNDLYKFHFLNTRTDATDSPHKEQQKSATYYALTVHNIPAFGVETSKFLPSTDLKVWFHNLVINAFMEEFDIIPQSPGLALDPPVLNYIIVSIDGETPIVVKKDESLILSEGSTINVSHIESNYERGLSLDILGYGDLNDYRKDFEIFRDTSILIRKDNQQFAEIPVIISKDRQVSIRRPSVTDAPYTVEHFSIEMKGSNFLYKEGETVEIVKGEKIRITDVFPRTGDNITVNFKGFVGDRINNTGEDRGYSIDTGKDLMDRYSIDESNTIYPVIVTNKRDSEIGRLLIKLMPPQMEYLVLRINNQKHMLLRNKGSVTLNPEDTISFEEIQTNLSAKTYISVNIGGRNIAIGETAVVSEICGPSRSELTIKSGDLTLGGFFINLSR